MRQFRTRQEALNALVGVPMKLIATTEEQAGALKSIPYEYGEPAFSDYTFGPALTWVFEFKGLIFTVYTDLDGNWNIDAQRTAHWIKVDEFIQTLTFNTKRNENTNARVD